jgi:hypothetical protein
VGPHHHNKEGDHRNKVEEAEGRHTTINREEVEAKGKGKAEGKGVRIIRIKVRKKE